MVAVPCLPLPTPFLQAPSWPRVKQDLQWLFYFLAVWEKKGNPMRQNVGALGPIYVFNSYSACSVPGVLQMWLWCNTVTRKSPSFTEEAKFTT